MIITRSQSIIGRLLPILLRGTFSMKLARPPAMMVLLDSAAALSVLKPAQHGAAGRHVHAQYRTWSSCSDRPVSWFNMHVVVRTCHENEQRHHHYATAYASPSGQKEDDGRSGECEPVSQRQRHQVLVPGA
jgi:hypothetical protein